MLRSVTRSPHSVIITRVNIKGEMIMAKTSAERKLLIPLSMGYALLLLCEGIFSSHFMYLPYTHITCSPAVFLLALVFVMGDILTEVYGYRIMQRIFISGIIMEGIFVAIITLITRHPELNAPQWWLATQSQAAFQQAFHGLPLGFASTTTALLLSVYLNARIISRWKILLKGRYFWLRSIGASGIGLLLFSCIFIALATTYGFEKDVELAMDSFLTKVVLLIIFAYPANVIAWLLKKIEGIDTYDYYQTYNPFKNF